MGDQPARPTACNPPGSDGRTVVCSTTDGAVVAGAQMSGVTMPAEAIAVDDDGGVVIGGAGHVDYLAVEGDSFRAIGAVDARFSGERIEIGPIAVSGGTAAVAVRPASSPASFARVLVWDAVARGTPVQFETDHRDLAALAVLGQDAELVAAAGAPTQAVRWSSMCGRQTPGGGSDAGWADWSGTCWH